MENSQELDTRQMVGQRVIHDMLEQLDTDYAGRVVDHWQDASKAFLMQKRYAHDIPQYGEIIRQYGKVGPDGETYVLDNLIFFLDDIHLNKISEVQITRLGEARAKDLVLSYERLGIPLGSVLNQGNRLKFTTVQIDRELAIQYDDKGELLNMFFQVPHVGGMNINSENGSFRLSHQEIEDIRNNKDEERNFPFIQKIGDVHAVRTESGLDLTVLSDEGKDVIKIPWYANREQLLSDLGVDTLLEEPTKKETEVDNRWRMKSLKRELGINWDQQREFKGMYEDRD